MATKIGTWQLEGIEVALWQLPILKSNFTYLLTYNQSAICVDPGESAAIMEFLSEHDLQLKYVLVTHYDPDHYSGIEKLKDIYDFSTIGPASEVEGIADQKVEDEEELIIDLFEIRVYSTPGHVKDHVIYYFPSLQNLFSGDLLYQSGCGRVMETGNMEELYESLQLVKKFSKETLVLPAHEYTRCNAQFACTVLPDDAAFSEKFEKVKSGQYPSYTTIGDELRDNIFLRTDERVLQEALGAFDEVSTFTELRLQKDRFNLTEIFPSRPDKPRNDS